MGEVKRIPMLVTVRVGDTVQLKGRQEKAEIVGTFDGRVLARLGMLNELVEIHGVVMDED